MPEEHPLHVSGRKCRAQPEVSQLCWQAVKGHQHMRRLVQLEAETPKGMQETQRGHSQPQLLYAYPSPRENVEPGMKTESLTHSEAPRAISHSYPQPEGPLTTILSLPSP